MKEEISVSEFKATCLKIIEEIRTSGKSITVTKNGIPAVRIIRAPVAIKSKKLFGALKDYVVEEDDIVSPLGNDEWDVFKSR